MTASLQIINIDRIALEKSQGTPLGGPQVNYLSVNPGFLKVAFTRFHDHGTVPVLGIDMVVQLIIDDRYQGGSQREYEDGKVQQVHW